MSPAQQLFASVVGVTLCFSITCVNAKEKRILLTDSNDLQQQLNNIQATLQQFEVVKSHVGALHSQLTAQDALIKLLMAKNQDLESKIENGAASAKGTIYIRWGRKDCNGNGTELVYSGFAGGSFYTHSGAASDYICLPPDPTWGPHKDMREFLPSLMYGAEYEDTDLFGMPNRNEEVPCAVCRTSAHSTSIMIPARTECYPGWVEAYHGNLAGNYFGNIAGGEYVCVDADPVALVGGDNVNDDGKLFFQVRTRCGSLKCPPYENNKVLSCVVCLK
ncbi:short-chain collagen C4-like [Ylistrum balloti]|uniref:short-chain collagen C4-like n=1 Tax=Ylistrum balloti TaxID=509963 RepID=UPI002905D752|nr:short-chain collagen C4-like [Ylistrum balloti]